MNKETTKAIVQFGQPVEGVWLKDEKGEVCVYTDKTSNTVVIGKYENLEKPVMTKCISFDKDGKVTVQIVTNTGDLAFIDVTAEKASELLVRFLDSIAGIY